jgi:hypothetical protein
MRMRDARVSAVSQRGTARVPLALLIAMATGHAASALERPPAIVIGFVGGFVRHDGVCSPGRRLDVK